MYFLSHSVFTEGVKTNIEIGPKSEISHNDLERCFRRRRMINGSWLALRMRKQCLQFVSAEHRGFSPGVECEPYTGLIKLYPLIVYPKYDDIMHKSLLSIFIFVS